MTSTRVKLKSAHMGERWKSRRGQSLVEVAFIIPLFLLITFGVIDFASAFYVYLALENGVAQGTRYAVTGQQMDDPVNAGQKLSLSQKYS